MHLREAALTAAIRVAVSPLGFVPAYAQQADATDEHKPVSDASEASGGGGDPWSRPPRRRSVAGEY